MKGMAQRLDIEMLGARPGQRVRLRFVDQERGSPMPAWRAMGSPQDLKPEQRALLRQRAAIAPATIARLNDARRLGVELPAEGVVLIETII